MHTDQADNAIEMLERHFALHKYELNKMKQVAVGGGGTFRRLPTVERESANDWPTQIHASGLLALAYQQLNQPKLALVPLLRALNAMENVSTPRQPATYFGYVAVAEAIVALANETDVANNYQVISMMPTVFKIDYPSGFESAIKVLRVLSLDILKAFSLDCSFNLSYLDRYLFAMLTPPLLVAIILAIGQVNGQSLNDMIGSVSLVLFLLYPSISAKTFELFECRDLGDGTRLHKLDYALDCESDTYAGYEAFASLMIAMYPVGIPAIFALMTFRRKVKLDVEVNEDATEYRHGSGAWHAVDGDEDKLSDVLEVQHQMDFLCGSYERRFFWWELVEYGRKFLLTGALIFVEQESVSQTFIGMSISFFFFAVHRRRAAWAARGSRLAILVDCAAPGPPRAVALGAS